MFTNNKQAAGKGTLNSSRLACVASVFVGLRSKERLRNGIFDVWLPNPTETLATQFPKTNIASSSVACLVFVARFRSDCQLLKASVRSISFKLNSTVE